MSIKVMTHVWDNSAATGTPLLMLLAIADHANEDGVCWPSIERLAKKARVGVRQAKRLIADLEASGEIEIERGIGRNNTSIYRVKGVGDDTLPLQKTERVSRKTPIAAPIKGDIQREKVTSTALKGDIAMSPEPSVEPSLEPSVKERGAQAKQTAPPPPQKPQAVALFKKLVGFPPDVISEQLIINSIGSDETSLRRWSDTVQAWLTSGYRGNNVRGMVDWYVNGVPVYNAKGNGKATNGQVGQRVAAAYDPRLEAEFN